ncbi:MAG: hypothetical protein Q9226_003433 [Calogaya cf. arnoldii]
MLICGEAEKTETVLLDMHTLGASAFSTPGTEFPPTTLSTILCDPAVLKGFFDLRSDSNALFFQFGIRLQGIVDLQLMELGSRDHVSKRYLRSLAKCVTNDASLSVSQKIGFDSVKKVGAAHYLLGKGGNYEVFNVRPLKEGIVKYCENDEVYFAELSYQPGWKTKVETETRKGVEFSQSMVYEPGGPQNMLGPWQKDVSEGEIEAENEMGLEEWAEGMLEDQIGTENEMVLQEWAEGILEDDIGTENEMVLQEWMEGILCDDDEMSQENNDSYYPETARDFMGPEEYLERFRD